MHTHLQVLLIMKGPVDTVSIPVPLHVGHLSGFDPGSLPVPGQTSQTRHHYVILVELTFTLVTGVHDAHVHVLLHPLCCLLEGKVNMILLRTKVKLLCRTPTTTLTKVAEISKR